MNRWFPAMRDVTLLAVGVFGILYQLITGDVNLALLTVFTAMLGIPGVTNGLWLLKHGGEQLAATPPGPSSSSQSTQTSSLSSEEGSNDTRS